MNALRVGHCILMLGILCQTEATALSQCTAPATWFPHASTPEPDFHQPASECEFHQWAWQEFLWLTQPTGPGRIRLLDMPTAQSLFAAGRAPAPLDSRVAQARLATQVLSLKVRTTESPSTTSISDIRQAGTKGVLVDQAGHSVYYASFVSSTFYEFVRGNELFRKDKYLAADPNLNFPTKSLELKSSWMVVPDDDVPPGFFTTKALVPQLLCANGGQTCMGTDVQIGSPTQPVTVALVGLHVVGALAGHPEFVWATFEHVNNAPDLPAGAAPNAAIPVSNVNSTFYRANTLAKDCNAPNAGLVSLNLATQALSPITNVFRQFPFGGGNADDTANIMSLNQSVHDQLEATSVWRNYMLVGGVWFANGNNLAPGLDRDTIQNFVVGSVQVSNTTMETFAQAPAGHAMKANCFTCHFTRAEAGIPAKNLNLSHILKNGLIQREEFHQLAKLNLPGHRAIALREKGVEISDLVALQGENLLNSPPKKEALMTYADVQKLLNDFVSQNQIPISIAPHGAFWNTMTYDQFTTGNIPGVTDDAGKPLKVIAMNDGDHSNLVMALRGTPGTIFDPNTGSIGQMPPGGPFMPLNDVQRIADWINAGAPK